MPPAPFVHTESWARLPDVLAGLRKNARLADARQSEVAAWYERWREAFQKRLRDAWMLAD